MDLMEFSMTEGNDTLTGDENFLPPQLMQTPVVVNSILKPSTKGNLMQLHTPKPQQKNLKVKFETPHSVKKVTPTRYEQIADLDEKENWIERTAIVTKTDHMLNIECAKDILNNLVENLPILKSESTANKSGNESDEETFFDASDETEKAIPSTLGHSGLAHTVPVSAPQQVADPIPVSAPQKVADTLPVLASPAVTGILDVSMECCEAEDLVTDEPMDCDETAIETTVICNKTLVEDKALGQEIVQDNPVTLVTSPPLPASKGTYSIDFDNLDSFNPFQTKAAITNSPVLDVVKDSKVEDGGKDVAEQAPLKTGAVEGILDSQAPEGILDIEVEVGTDMLSEVLSEVGREQQQGVYSLDFDEKADPFATKSQVKNSPLSADAFPTKLPVHGNEKNADVTTVCNSQSFPVNEDVTIPKQPLIADDGDPFSTKSKVINSPAAVLNNSNPFATKANVCNSPILPPDEMTSKSSQLQSPIKNNNADQFSLPTGLECLDTMSMKSNMANLSSSSVAVDTLNSCDPFATKSNVMNSPVPGAPKEENLFVSNVRTSNSIEVSQNAGSQSDEGKISDIKFDLDIELFPRGVDSQMVSGSENTVGNICTDKSNTDKQSAPTTETDLKVETVEVSGNDPFTTNSKVPNSPLSSETARKDPLADLDPFSTSSRVANSPAPSVKPTEDPAIDPFSTSSRVANSPAPSVKPTEDPVIDPFSTSSRVANSPTPSVKPTEDPVIDPFSTKSKVANSPPPSAKPTEDPMIDPFSTKSKVANSPAPSAKSTEDPMIDPFSTKSKVANSPAPSAKSTEDPMIDPFSTKSKVANSPPSAKPTEDPMIDPFSTKSKVANSPAPSAKSTEDPMIDPFSTKSKVLNSPSPQAPTEVKVSNLPEMTSQTVQQVSGLSSSENTFSEGGFPNITKKSTVPESASSVPDFSDEEFRPATECLFNDASFLDVLEKFGSSNTESKASDLARMSLYVKFDPLVDLPASDPRRASMNLLKRASIMNMPRRSLSGKSLSDMCNAEESMLLMGTPPKQMSRLANVASRTQHTGFTPGSIPTTPKAFKPQLDLLCANTPPRSVKKSTTPAPAKVNSNLPEEPADNLASSSDDNIIEVLQYTDKDMCEMKTSLFLEFQGQKLLLEREWTKVVDKLKAKIEEQNKTLEKKQADIELMGNISKELENIVEGLIQEKEKGKTVTVELQKERDQAVQDTQSLEKAFSELHRRNEKLKEALSGYVKNQETLTAHAKELQKALTGVKTESKEKITELSQQLAKAKSDLNLITTSSEARAKRDKLQIESLQKTVDQKMSENKELTQMCDELLAKVSK